MDQVIEIEKRYVHESYDKIPELFDNTRQYTWPKVREFSKSLKTNSLILDAGCGNGRNLNIRKDCHYIGSDVTPGLINISRKKAECVLCNVLKMPFKDNSFDAVLSIAVIHHLSTEYRRIQAIREMTRVLKIGGKMLIYVWAKEQPRFQKYSQQDIMVPWKCRKTGKKICDRYYHTYIKDELETSINNINGLCIIESGNQCYNWYCIVKKKSNK